MSAWIEQEGRDLKFPAYVYEAPVRIWHWVMALAMVVPVLLLALAVGAVVTSGSSLVDLVGTNPPPADEFDIRRVEFSPGEIRITVRNPQPDDLTIANVNVDDAIEAALDEAGMAGAVDRQNGRAARAVVVVDDEGR